MIRSLTGEFYYVIHKCDKQIEELARLKIRDEAIEKRRAQLLEKVHELWLTNTSCGVVDECAEDIT